MYSVKRSWNFILLYRLWNLLGVNPFRLTKTSVTEPLIYAPVQAILRVVLFSYICFKVIIGRFSRKIPGDTDVIFVVDIEVVVMKFMDTSVFWLSSGFFHKRLTGILDNCRTIESTSRKIGIHDDPNVYIRNVTVAVLFFNVMWMLSVPWSVWQIARAGQILDSEWFFIYQNVRVVSYNMLLLLCSGVFFVRRKFQQLNEHLKSLADDHGEDRLVHEKRTETLSLQHELRIFGEVHRQTYDLLDKIIKHFEFPLLVTIALHSAYITKSIYTNWLYFHSNPVKWDYPYIISVTYWIFLPLVSLMTVTSCCSVTCMEGNRTAQVLHTLQLRRSRRCDESAVEQFNSFSLQLLQKRVRVTLYGLFNIDYHFYLHVIVSVATCIVILCQFDMH